MRWARVAIAAVAACRSDPSEAFGGRVAIEVEPALESARLASVIGTAAFAGYPNQEVHAGGASFDSRCRPT